MKKLVLPLLLLTIYQQQAHAEGYYVSGKFLGGEQKADNMETSLRPRVGDVINIDSKDKFARGAIALGYKYDNNWQVELEYNSKVDSEYRTGSTRFANSLNNYQVSTEKLMVNTYRAIPINNIFSFYGQAGLGLAKVDVGGWQGVESRSFYSNTQTNLAYSVGAGVRADMHKSVFVDLGYRYTGIGKVESGMNNFDNNYGNTLRDEQLKADLSEQEIYLGMSYIF
ncbi:outer membrane protein [Aeromonas sp. SG16]|uniref:outer membrane protein n=1 Tax=Aeromonas sp. SG16 TaxID=2950548 RepID=UPI00210A7249|nr:outer membrane beta-barrel protein [Aeromonas sp. SG16]MCQ4054428.1 outer membrane beta-barrel protein [Aeromonas sp. SG16]